MAEIRLDDTKLNTLITALQELETTINSFSRTNKDTGYVKNNLFEKSSGKSVDSLNTT